MERTQDLTLDYVAPIPVGNRVEVIQYKEVTIDRKGREEINPVKGLWIKDLDTGIEYGVSQHFEKRKLWIWFEVQVWPVDVRSDLVIDKKFTGRVTRCRIMSMRSNEDWQLQTRLFIESTGQDFSN
jgi:hypothetical protein